MKSLVPISLYPTFHGPTLNSFRNTCHSLKITPSPGPMTPLTGNPDFLPGCLRNNVTNADTECSMRAHHLFDHGHIISFAALSSICPDNNISFFHFLQIRHFLSSIKPISQWFRELHLIESLCSMTSPQSHLISTVYAFRGNQPQI